MASFCGRRAPFGPRSREATDFPSLLNRVTREVRLRLGASPNDTLEASITVKLINSLTTITLIASLAAACSQSDNESGSGGETAGAGGGQPQICPDEGACIAMECGAPLYTMSCESIDECVKASTVCPTARLEVDYDTGAVTVDMDSSLTCILEGLRDAKPDTRFRWESTLVGESFVPGQFGSTSTLEVRSNRQAVLVTSSYQDLGSSSSFLGHLPLQDASFFEGCLASSAAKERYDCLRNALPDKCP